jgi:hypothetical protein
MNRKPNLLRVHGVWADGSIRSKVIPKLEATGLQVKAFQMPLASLDVEVAAPTRAIVLEDGPTLLVGLSRDGVASAGELPPTSAESPSCVPQIVAPMTYESLAGGRRVPASRFALP